ncbi:MAG: tetratricopeptide repeat protein [Gammaproteobacteria bacterium]|nr:tetratricopeptide repeat protein [Gammaproteobacteria bacterium]
MSDYPYPGLRPFSREETDIFFGREAHTDQLLEQLDNNHFLAVIGPSGCGKSSLVRTGLLAGLETGFLSSAGSQWRIAEMRPGVQPFTALSLGLLDDKALGQEYRTYLLRYFNHTEEAESFEQTASSSALLQAKLRRGPFSIQEILMDAALRPGANLLILVDQFEEIFRYYHQGAVDDAAAFVALLLGAVQHDNVYAVITMRSDFLGDCALFHGLPEAINQNLYLTPRLTREQLREAIEQPALVFGRELDPALVNRLLNDLGDNPDQLPVLQHALMRMWRIAPQETPENPTGLNLNGYQQIGGLHNALSQHADQVYQELDSQQRQTAKILFCALCEYGGQGRDTRRPVKLSELAAVAEVPWQEAAAIIERFRMPERSFLTPPPDKPLTPDRVIDISHESLIRQWQCLTKWTEEERESAQLYQRLEDAAIRHKKQQAALWRSPELDTALAWRKRFQPKPRWAARYGRQFESAMAFLEESEAEQHREQAAKKQAERERLRLQQRVIRHLAMFLIIALGTLAVAAWQWTEAEHQKVQAQKAQQEAEKQRNQARRALISLAELIAKEGNGTKAVLMNLAALEVLPEDQATVETYPDQLRAALYQSIIQNREKAILQAHRNDYSQHAAFSPDGRQVIIASSDHNAYLWDVRTNQQLAVLKGHAEKVTHAEFSPNGQYIVTASDDGAARIWDVQTKQLLHLLEGHQGEIYTGIFSPDSAHVATASADGAARVWSADTGEVLYILEKHDEHVVQVRFSPDGRLLATQSEKAVHLWQAATGEHITELKGHTDTIDSIAFSPDSRYLVTASTDTARIWSMENGKIQMALKHDNNVSYACFSPDGQRVATVSWDKTLRLWDVHTGKLQEVMRGHENRVSHVAFSSDGKRLITSSRDNTVRLWEAGTGRVLAVLKGHEIRPQQAVFSPDGAFILSRGKKTHLWHTDAEQKLALLELKGHGDIVRHVEFSPDNTRILSGSMDGTARLWNADTGESIFTLQEQEDLPQVLYAGFSSDGQRILTATTADANRLWDAQSGQQLYQWDQSLPGRKFYNAAFSPDGQHAVTADTRNILYVWDTNTGKSSAELVGHTRGVNHIAISPDGKWIASASADMTVHLWELKSGIKSRVLKGHGSAREDAELTNVFHVDFSPDSKQLVSASEDGAARLWNVESGHVIHTFKHQSYVLHASFSPDGQYILTTLVSPNAFLWDSQTGKKLHTLLGHTSTVWHGGFSPDGRYVATASWDGTARIWDVVSGQQLAVLKGEQGELYYVAFSPDGQRLATAGGNGSVKVWRHFDNASLLAYARQHVPRDLTCVERAELALDTIERCCFVADENIRGEYQGPCVAGKAHGTGQSVGVNRYDGEFVDGYKHGKGTYFWADGTSYEGVFDHGKEQRLGKIHENVDGWLLKGADLLENQRFADAEQAFRQLLIIKPNHSWAWQGIAETFIAQEEYDKALEVLQKQLEIKPDHEETWTSICHIHYMQTNYAKAVEACEQQLEIKQSNMDAWNLLANSYYKMKQYEKAAQIFAQALALEPDNLSILLNDFELAAVQGDIERIHRRWPMLANQIDRGLRGDADMAEYLTVAVFIKWLAMPDQMSWSATLGAIEFMGYQTAYDWDFLTMRPLIERQADINRQAADYFIAHFENKTDLPALKENLSNLIDEKLAEFNKQLEIEPEHPQLWHDMGSFLELHNKPDKAIAAYRQQVEVQPEHPQSWYRLGLILNAQKKPEEAIAAFRKQTDIHPEHEKAWHQLGLSLWWTQDKRDQAAEAFAKGLSIKKEDEELLYHDLELALVQKDSARFQTRLDSLSALIEPQQLISAILKFYTWLQNPKQDWKHILIAIDALAPTVEYSWDFSSIMPVINRLDKQHQQRAGLFIDFFTGEIDLDALRKNLGL